MKTKKLPSRDKVKTADTWNLASLFATDAAWEKAFKDWEGELPRYAEFKGKLGESAESLANLLAMDATLDQLSDKLSVYAFLKTAEDQANSDYQRMKGRFIALATKFSEAAAYIRPEILAIPEATMTEMLASPELEDWKLALERILRYRPHTLGDGEEKLLAMQGQMSDAANQIFRQLNDADLKWASVRGNDGKKLELGHSAYSNLLHIGKPGVRKDAFHVYYDAYDTHKNTLAAAYNGSVQRDAYYAKARGYPSAIESALFADNVPVSVYDNLIKTVRKGLPKVHAYYEVRRRALKLKKVHAYDTYAPIVQGVDKKTKWDDGVKLVVEAVAPLGTEYQQTLADGMTVGRWCDRFPNKGKQSGAFSYGTYEASPYILMNYQPEVLDHVFTLAHEAGHSMHSWYSARTQPYQYYGYTIFVAEVASTFNEQLLAKHLMDRAQTKKERAHLINMLIDDIRSTVVRQTMFAEFEKTTHALVEAGEPLTVETLRAEYRKLLDAYFGPDFAIDPVLELECLRIPHFYRAFYVYKYATGLSAAIALSQRVLNGGQSELDAYLTFLKGGCSKWPLDLLKDAGVDMTSPKPIEAAMKLFGKLVDELDELV